jgi:hypothetical protein
MEIKNIKDFTLNDPELDALAARIRPLPPEIVPSQQFMASMRLRILQLTELPTNVRRAA